MENMKKMFLKGLEKVGEMLCVAMVFAAIALISFGLGLLVHFFEANGADPHAIALLKAAELIVLAVDVWGLIVHVLVHAIHAAQKTFE